MYDLLLAVHLVLAVFAVGPLVHGATTAGRGVRTGNGVATASSARMLRIYGYVSVLVVISGLILANQYEKRLDPPDLPDDVGGHLLGHTWIWLSFALWVVAIGVVLGVAVPTLDKATSLIEQEKSVVTLTGRVAAAGGIVAVSFLVIVVLMVYRPGQ